METDLEPTFETAYGREQAMRAEREAKFHELELERRAAMRRGKKSAVITAGTLHVPIGPTPENPVIVAARALPDTLFAGDPEIKELAGALEVQQRRLDNWKNRGDGFGLRTAIAQLEIDFKRAQAGMANAAIDDVLDGDAEFEAASAAARRIEVLQRRLECARAALAFFNLPPLDQQDRLTRAVAEARRAHLDALFACKFAYIKAHPELLAQAKKVA